MSSLSKSDIERLLKLLNDKLRSDSVTGEIYVVGGAVMCMVFDARESTQDVDAYFKPTNRIREAAIKVAKENELDARWLNDAVKGYLSSKGSYSNYMELSNLRVFAAKPEYLLAMKCLAMRIGEEFQDLDDIRYLLRNLAIETYQEAVAVITKYYPLGKFPQKTMYALEELLGRK